MKQPENFLNKNDQVYLQTLIDSKNRYDDDNIKYSKMFITSKIAPQENNDNINPETEFPIITDLTSYHSIHGHADLSLLSRKGSGWNYFDKFVIKNGQKLDIDNKKYTIEVATVRNVIRREMVLKDLEDGQLVRVDLKKGDNLNYLYEQIKLNQKQELNKKTSIKP